jgi:hypothetical protein
MVRQGGRRDCELILKLADNEAPGMSREEQANDGDPGLVSERREHSSDIA